MAKASPTKRRYRMTRRAEGARRTGECILEATTELWLESPYDEVTLQRVADAAGVSLQTVLVHFGSKAGLVEAVVAWNRSREEQNRDVPVGDLAEAVRVLCGRYEVLGKATLRVLAIEDRVPSVRPMLDAGRESHRAWIEYIFSDAIGAAGSKAARRRRTMALVTATDLYSWHVLRRVLDAGDTVRTMTEMVRAITHAPEPEATRQDAALRRSRTKRAAGKGRRPSAVGPAAAKRGRES